MINLILTTCIDCGVIIGVEAENATYTGEVSNQKNKQLHAEFHRKIEKALGTLWLEKKQ